MALHITEFSLVFSTGTVSSDEIFTALHSTYGLVGLLALAAGMSLNVFFALSGYLIARPFVDAYVQGRPRPRLGRYARNRILRIVPAFWCAVLATLLAFGLSGSEPFAVVLTLAFSQIYIPADPFAAHIAQGWTLDVEFAFYVAVPVVGLALARWRSGTAATRARRVLALCVLMVFGSTFWAMLGSGLVWLQALPALAYAFAPGVALAAAASAWPAAFDRPLVRRLALPLLLAGVGLLVLNGTIAAQGTIWSWISERAAGGLIVAGALFREWSGTETWWLLRNRVTVWLGERSYSIYVFHYGVGLWLAQRVAISGHPRETLLLLTALALPVTLLLADASWTFVEQPFLRLKKRSPLPAPAVERVGEEASA
jgi:peptidoglycan/LPS O-acetylase OafA/YrhL